MTITQTIDIPADRRITLEVPREVPTGRTTIAFTPASPAKTEPSKEREFGCMKEKIWTADDFDAPLEENTAPQKIPVFGCSKGKYRMAEDFDAPLEDFKDYM